MNLRKATYPAIFATMTFFAANSVITRYLLRGDHVSPFTLTAIRFLRGYIMLHVMSFLHPGFNGNLNISRNTIIGAIFLGIYAYSISYGYKVIPASEGVLVFYLSVVLTMTLISLIQERESLAPRNFIGIITGIAGIYIITNSGLNPMKLQGLALMAITGISWGLYCINTGENTNSFSYTYNTFLILAAIISTICIIGYILFPAELRIDSTRSLACCLVLGTISTALSYVMWRELLTRLKPSQGALAQLAVPIITVILGVLFIGEDIKKIGRAHV